MYFRSPTSQVSISLSLLPHGTLKLLFTSALPSTFGSNSVKEPHQFSMLEVGRASGPLGPEHSWMVEGTEVNLRLQVLHKGKSMQ